VTPCEQYQIGERKEESSVLSRKFPVCYLAEHESGQPLGPNCWVGHGSCIDGRRHARLVFMRSCSSRPAEGRAQ